MAQRQQLYESQKEISDEIAVILTKLESGSIRSSTFNQYQTRIESLEAKFRSNDEKLLKLGKTSEDYFEKNYFEMVTRMIGRCKIATLKEMQVPEEDTASVTRGEIKQIIQQLLDAQRTEKTISQVEQKPENYSNEVKEVQQEKLKTNWLIHFRKEIQKLEESFLDVNESNILILEHKQRVWEKKILNIRSIYRELVISHNVEEDVEEELELIEKQYEETLDELLRKISALKEEKKTVVLEAIRIPTFNGDIEEWLSFKNMFNQFVHLSNLPAVEKLVRLKNHVKGEALKIIQNLPITESNYEIAWEILSQRYNNKRILFTKLVDKILDQPNTNINVANSLRHLLNITNESIQALKAMGVQLNEADPIMARVILKKLDKDGLVLYEQSTKKSKDIQKLSDVMNFIERQCEALEASSSKKYNSSSSYDKKHQERTTMLSTGNGYCNYCKKNNHKMWECTKFINLTVEGRNTWVRNAKICKVCLSHKMDKRCFHKTKCEKCGKMHHNILHINYEQTAKTSQGERPSSMNTKAQVDVLLATVQVKVRSINGELILLRALIDQGSQVTTVSEEAAQILALPRSRSTTEIYGLGGAMVGVAKAKTKLIIKPRFLSDKFVEVDALILPQLTGAQPSQSFKFNASEWKNYVLADPALNKSDRIDIVIGMDIITSIIEEGVFKKGGLLAQSTIFGWILSGIINKKNNSGKALVATSNLERFWELEEVTCNTTNNEEDKECQDLFEETTELDGENRIVVNLPIRREGNQLGDSRKQAMARLLSLEKKLDANIQLRQDYNKFMQEYLKLGHMVLESKPGNGKYYLPHQAVIREESITTKLRVVFDASAKSSNGNSLNDIMYAGPRLQRDIFDIITKWRLWKYVITADVEKMYRQIKVAQKHQAYQHILWRESKQERIKEYKLTTVTYGTSSAPFLAVRSLFFIADNCQNEEISKIIKEDFYMDDLMTGGDTIDTCKQKQIEIQKELEYYGFILRKWLSNDIQIIEHVSSLSDNAIIQIKDEETVKTLGLQWDPKLDNFRFNFSLPDNNKLTKRQALSKVARIFDPLGWLSPVIVVAKLFVQKLWLLNCKWDEPLSDDMNKEWQQFTNGLPDLQEIRIPRWVQLKNNQEFELHGFADASEKAYAAVVYLKIENSVMILTSKTKVNPIKNRKTLPKLELCAANLLAKLLFKVADTLKRQHLIYAWSDSKITLAWIANSKNKDKFIRNRVTEILQLIPDANWNYVRSKENPADIASRGINAQNLRMHSLWWNGPEWLILPQQKWPKNDEVKTVVVTHTLEGKGNLLRELCNKYSSFTKLVRVVAYIIKFISKLRKKSYSSQHLSITDLQTAEKKILRCHQEQEFSEEIISIKENGIVSKTSKILSLFPFMDGDGLLRVGGRLQNANLPYEQQYPIIMKNSFLTSLLVKRAHISTLHGGNRLVEAALKKRYWILNIKSCIKKYIRSCTRCIRYGQKLSEQLMGSLPAPRVTMSAPFQHVGVDYAGPVQLRCSRGRGQKSYKGYIAVFVCMATKAIHLEVVSDLTSEAFLAALRRFFGRRGASSDIYSDNGTNFIGANRILDKDVKTAIRKNETIIPILQSQKIRWHFIPPAAPHFGGIWEAGVKSVKFHLKRTIGETKLTYEEMSTLLVQIEAVLNSRPLVALNTNDVSQTDVLTPGHFLIGRPLNDWPEHIEETRISSLDRWKLIQKLRKDFWIRWKMEYLATLQQRNKWKFPSENLKEGTVVLIKDENTSPAKWPMGKIADICYGKDGKVRVVTLKLPNGTLKRPVNKLIPLRATDEQTNKTHPVKACLAEVKTPNKKHQNWIKVLPIMLLLILALMKPVKSLPTGLNDILSIKELSQNTAVYLDHVGQVNSISSKWNLVVYYDLSLYFEEVFKIGKLISKMKEVCPELEVYEESCRMVVSAVERRYSLLMQNNELFISQSRKKRAPFEFVGSIYHILFGMMDADDRAEMEKNMKNIFSNQQDLNELIKKQTSIIDSTVNILKKTTDDVNENFKKMYNQLENIYKGIEEERKTDQMTILFSVLSMQLNLMVDECHGIQSSVINILIDANHGHINTNLLTPSQLHKELTKIEKVMPKNLELPGKTTGTELKEAYHGMRAKGIVMERQLMVQVEIPLFQAGNSELYKLIKLPIKINNTVVIPRIEDEFIVYNFATNMYHLLSQANLNKCEKNLQDQYNCIENMPWKPATERSCEVSALKQSRVAECTFEAVQKKGIWKKLSSENKWIFTVFDSMMLTVDCGQGKRRWVPLPMKGILELSHGCTATYDGLSITTARKLGSVVKTSIQASSWKMDPEKIQHQLIKPLYSTMINNTDDINKLKNEVKEFKENSISLRGLHFHTASGHISLTLIIIIILILIGLVLKKKCSSKEIVTVKFSTPLPLRNRNVVG